MPDNFDFPENSDITDIDDSVDSNIELNEGYDLPRITFKSLFLFVLSVLNFERGIFFTIKELIIRPRVVIEEYLKKDRKKLVNPIRFLVFSTALAAFLNITLINQNPEFNPANVNFENSLDAGIEMGRKEKQSENITKGDSIEKPIDSTELTKAELKKQKIIQLGVQVQEITKNSSDKFTFILVLFFSFFSFLFYRKNGYNFTENLVINVYMSSITSVFGIIFFTLTLLTGQIIFLIIASAISFIYTIYYWTCVYNRKSFGGVLRSLMVYLTSYFTFVLIIAIITVIYIFSIMSS